jgi:translation initiation factor IF-3
LTAPARLINTQKDLTDGFILVGTVSGVVPEGTPTSTHTRKGKEIDRVQTRINEQIRISPIRVIASDGSVLGIIPTEEALAKARAEELDLVEVAPNERPPVCRIMDFGKYKYDKKKKSHQHAHHTKTKEIRLRPKTGEHDIGFKVKQAITFLQHKDKVQVSVLFRGRELAHVEEGRKVMQGVIEELLEFGKVEAPPQQHGRRMICTIAPK